MAWDSAKAPDTDQGVRDPQQQQQQPPPASAAVTEIMQVRGDNDVAVAAIATILHKYPSERDAIFRWLHEHRGNRFVQDVIAKSPSSVVPELPSPVSPHVEGLDPHQDAAAYMPTPNHEGADKVPIDVYKAGGSAVLLLGITLRVGGNGDPLHVQTSHGAPSKKPATPMQPFKTSMDLDLSKASTGDERFASLAEIMTSKLTISLHADYSADVRIDSTFKDKATEHAFKKNTDVWQSIANILSNENYFERMWLAAHPA